MTCLDGDRAAMFQLVIRFVQSMREVILRIAAIHYDIRLRFREYPARQSTLGSEKGVNYPSWTYQGARGRHRATSVDGRNVILVLRPCRPGRCGGCLMQMVLVGGRAHFGEPVGGG